jgi:hypothetical protein
MAAIDEIGDSLQLGGDGQIVEYSPKRAREGPRSMSVLEDAGRQPGQFGLGDALRGALLSVTTSEHLLDEEWVRVVDSKEGDHPVASFERRSAYPKQQLRQTR